MAMSFNQVTMVGNIGSDPETRKAGSSEVCSFRIAVNEKRGGNESTMWFTIDAWGKTGEFCQQYLRKGELVLVTGRLKSREYEGKTYLGIDASEVKGLSPRQEGGNQGGGGQGGGNNNRGNQGGGGGGGNWGNNNQGGGNNQSQQGGNQGGGGWGGNNGGGGGGGGNRNQGGGGQGGGGGWGGGGGDDPIPF